MFLTNTLQTDQNNCTFHSGLGLRTQQKILEKKGNYILYDLVL